MDVELKMKWEENDLLAFENNSHGYDMCLPCPFYMCQVKWPKPLVIQTHLKYDLNPKTSVPDTVRATWYEYKYKVMIDRTQAGWMPPWGPDSDFVKEAINYSNYIAPFNKI